MLKFGKSPYLECSSKGDKRFSAFYARLKKYDNKSIEEIYQAYKIFEDGSTGLTWKEAKGKKAVNQEDCAQFYKKLWDTYFEENEELLDIISCYNGFSDIFAKQGCSCQAEEIYRIKQEKGLKAQHILLNEDTLVAKYKYRKLPDALSKKVREDYLKKLPEVLKLKGDDKQLYSLEGTLIANKYNRIVVGDYGAFIELNEEDIVQENLEVKKGEEYRFSEKYNVKYLWYTARDTSDIKVYYQLREVSYADYVIGKCYVSPNEVSIKSS